MTMLMQRERTVRALNTRYDAAPAEEVLEGALTLFSGEIALVSSFGAEAAVLLHMLSRIDAAVPVVMIDTQLLFAETLRYQAALTARLGLRDVRIIRAISPQKDLHKRDTKACCHERKVVPLENALRGFAATITGRKRFQTGARAGMEMFEMASGRVKVNPLTDWTPSQIADYFTDHDLPRHPLVARGYPSIGCMPCTSPVADGEHSRAGRWRDEDREECGIHFSADGTIVRKTG